MIHINTLLNCIKFQTELRWENLFWSTQWRRKTLPLSSHPKLSLSLNRRFPAVKSEEVDQYSLVKAPKHTEQGNNWVTNNFEVWWRDYNGRKPGSEIRRHILGCMDCQELDEVLSTFTVDRNSKGEQWEISSTYALPAFLWTASLHFATSSGRGLTSVLF